MIQGNISIKLKHVTDKSQTIATYLKMWALLSWFNVIYSKTTHTYKKMKLNILIYTNVLIESVHTNYNRNLCVLNLTVLNLYTMFSKTNFLKA